MKNKKSNYKNEKKSSIITDKSCFGYQRAYKCNRYSIIYALLKAEGRTSSAKQTAEKTGNSAKIIFTNERKLKEWVSNQTNIGMHAVIRNMLSLKLDGVYTFDRETGEVHVNVIPDDLMDYCTTIPNYMKKDFVIKGKKHVWNANCQLVYDYLNRLQDCMKKADENGLFTRDFREVREVMKQIGINGISEEEAYDRIEKIQQRQKLCYDSIKPEPQLYLRARTIARNLGLTVSIVRKVLRQFRVFFGSNAWRKPTQTEVLTRVDYCSRSYTIEIPKRNVLREMMERFEEKCDEVVSRMFNLKSEYVFIN